MVIDRRSRVIDLVVETAAGSVTRKFELREHSLTDLHRYLAMQEEARNLALADIERELDGAPSLEQVAKTADKHEAEMFCWLLSRPKDGLEPATPALIEALTYSQRVAVKAAQDDLNSLDELLGNRLTLLELASSRRRAQQTVEAASDPC